MICEGEMVEGEVGEGEICEREIGEGMGRGRWVRGDM